MVVVASGCSGEKEARERPRPAETGATPSADDPFLGAAPHACAGADSRSITSTRDFGAVPGQRPLYLAIREAVFDRTSSIFLLQRDTPRTDRGWELDAVWLLSGEHRGAVTVRGRQLGDDGERVLFARGGQDPSPSLVLGGLAPSAGGGLRAVASRLYIPRAACFAISATHPGGRSRFVVGLGL